ncbi:MAG: hypothetical protein RQ745_08090 [Longimicrobiales bacterium]|nr:hypothetical protein [Longimicrobiales bacterium]
MNTDSTLRTRPDRATLAFITVALAVACAASAPLDAQTTHSGLVIDAFPNEVRELVIEAEVAATTEGRFRRSEHLYRAAAETMGDAPEAANLYMAAARMAYYAGSGRRALIHLDRAGEGALAWGDVNLAAHAFLDRAAVATELGEVGIAQILLERARRLSRSPLLQPIERIALAARLDPDASILELRGERISR